VSLLCELRIKGFGQLERDHRHGKHPAATPSSYQLPNGITAIVGGLCAKLAVGSTYAKRSGLLHRAFLFALADPLNAHHHQAAGSTGPRPDIMVAAQVNGSVR
jgi:hypothetical protein